jgi:hypothetical protein
MAKMNFLQRIVMGKVLKGLEKMAQKDPNIRGSFDELGKAAHKLQQDIDAHIKNSKDTFK